jgi:hypothetical protein
MEAKGMDEFLLVNFRESRQLLINRIQQGWTNIPVRLEAGTYEIGLAGNRNFSPDSQKVTLRHTAPMQPAELTFHVLPPSAIAPGASEIPA